MYEARDFGTLAIMLLVLPLFVAVFLVMCVIVAPFFLADFLVRALNGGSARA